MLHAGIELPESHLINTFIAEHPRKRRQEIVLIPAGAAAAKTWTKRTWRGEQNLVTADCPLALLLIGRNKSGTIGEGHGLNERVTTGAFFILQIHLLPGLCRPERLLRALTSLNNKHQREGKELCAYCVWFDNFWLIIFNYCSMGYLDKVDKLINHSRVGAAAVCPSGWKFSFSFFFFKSGINIVLSQVASSGSRKGF